MSILADSPDPLLLEEVFPWPTTGGELPGSILVTGAAGFVGSRLCRKLLDEGVEVTGFDNFDPYYERRHKERHLADLSGEDRFRLIEGDLRDPDAVARAVRTAQPQAIAHLAAMAAVRYSVRYPVVYGEVNVQGTVHLLQAAREVSSCRLVLASTGSVYGSDTPVPFIESSAADRPLAPYPASKRAMELMAHSYSHLWALPTTILRFFNVYGPHGRPDMMPWQWATKIAQGEPLTLFDGGLMRRDWTYIDDIVSGFCAALRRPLGYELINLGCGRPVENREFVRILEELIGRRAIVQEAPAPPSEPRITYADIAKARRLLGYAPLVPVEEGLRRFVEWMRAEKLLPAARNSG